MPVDVLFIGENIVVPPKLQMGSDDPKFDYMYMRRINNGAIETSFSNDLNELEERMKGELCK